MNMRITRAGVAFVCVAWLVLSAVFALTVRDCRHMACTNGTIWSSEFAAMGIAGAAYVAALLLHAVLPSLGLFEDERTEP